MKLHELFEARNDWNGPLYDPALQNKKVKKRIQLEKGLSHREALKQAPWKKSYGDCRGFHYDAKTGIAQWM